MYKDTIELHALYFLFSFNLSPTHIFHQFGLYTDNCCIPQPLGETVRMKPEGEFSPSDFSL